MRLTVLSVPGCPNLATLATRLDAVLVGLEDVTVTYRVVEEQADAEITGMHGSPTLLIDGMDPFAAPDVAPSISCRLYRTDDGHLAGAPTVEQLRQALAG